LINAEVAGSSIAEERNVVVAPNEVREVVLQLPGLASVACQVLTFDGAPLAGTVYLRNLDGLKEVWTEVYGQSSSSRPFTFVFRIAQDKVNMLQVVEGKYRLDFAGGNATLTQELHLRDGQELVLTLPDAGSLGGTVLSVAGSPLPNVKLLWCSGSKERRTSSGKDGAFRFARLPNEAGKLYVEDDFGGLELAYEGAPIGEDHSIRCQLGVVRGTLVESSTGKAVQARLNVSKIGGSSPGSFIRNSAPTYCPSITSGGKFEVALTPGKWVFTVRDSQWVEEKTVVDVAPGSLVDGVLFQLHKQ
jgi:hypothetical protein